MDRSHCELNLQVGESFSVDEAGLRRAVEETLRAEGIDSSVELGLVIADEGMVRELNRTYRGMDEGTDVLSFSLGEGDPSFVAPPNGVVHLGEVIVSYPQAVRQAEGQGHSPERELTHLVVHGVLHLLGYDDEVEVAERRMRAAEEEVWRRLERGANRGA